MVGIMKEKPELELELNKVTEEKEVLTKKKGSKTQIIICKNKNISDVQTKPEGKASGHK